MFCIAYTFKGQVHVFSGRVKIVSHRSYRTSVILKYFCPLHMRLLSLCILVDFPIQIQSIKMGLSIKYFKESQVVFSQLSYISVPDDCRPCVGPDEMPHRGSSFIAG